MTAGTVQFYFGPASRYSYLAASQLASLSDASGAVFEWVPLDTPALFALEGRAPFQPHGSGQYQWNYRRIDAQRWAALYGVPFVEPQGRLELDFALLALACTAACRMGTGAGIAYARVLMHQIFATSRTELVEADCVALAPLAGLDTELFRAVLRAPQTALQHQAALLRAREEGVFGVPSFVASGALFWGNDRLPLLRRHLLDEGLNTTPLAIF